MAISMVLICKASNKKSLSLKGSKFSWFWACVATAIRETTTVTLIFFIMITLISYQTGVIINCSRNQLIFKKCICLMNFLYRYRIFVMRIPVVPMTME